MDRQDIEALLPFYALDALTDEERGLVEKYLTEHPEARQQVKEMENAVSALPYGVTPVEPSRDTKERLMARVAADAEVRARSSGQAARPPARRASLFENLFRTFSLVTAAVAIIWVIILNAQVLRLRSQMAALNEQVAAQSESLDRVIETLNQTNVITVSLKGTEVQPHAQGQLIANPESQSAVLVISGLPKLEPGKTYQVWLINGGGPVSAGLLRVDENGQAVFIVTSPETIGSFKSLGISVEPDGGSPQPTGEIVVLSDI